jgi:hypothetical protein
MSQAELYDAFNFDADDLAANQRGDLSPGQVQHLKKVRTTTVVSLMVLMLPIAGCGTLTLIEGAPGYAVSLVLYVLFVGGLVGVPTLRALNRLSDLRQLGVESVEGRFDYDLDQDPTRRYFVFTVGGREFKVKQALGRALKAHTHYRMYYLAGLGGLLSVEVLAQGATTPDLTDTE